MPAQNRRYFKRRAVSRAEAPAGSKSRRKRQFKRNGNRPRIVNKTTKNAIK